MEEQRSAPKKAIEVGGYQGYKVLLEQILIYFQTGISPISREETIEIFTFMKASNMSKSREWKNCHIGRSLSKKVGKMPEN